MFKLLMLASASLASTPVAFAQLEVIQSRPEGTSGTTVVLPFSSLRDLDRGTGTAPDPFFVDDASGSLRFERGWQGPNVINFDAAVAGPLATFGRCKSFVIDINGVANRIFLGLCVSRAQAGNTLHFDVRSAGATVQTADFVIPPGQAPYRMSFSLGFVPPTTFDEIHVSCSGPHAGGTFQGVLDRLTFLGAGDSVPPYWCGASISGGNTPCPCGNGVTNLDQEGCQSSLGFGGRLRDDGVASLASDTLELLCLQLPSTTAILIQGSGYVQTGVVFGDGVSCLSGNLVRIATRRALGNQLHYPDPGEAPLSVRGAVSAGASFGYQVVYRNAASFCTSATSNVSDAVLTFWSP